MYPSTPPIYLDESLAGYLFRVAEENGYDSSSWVAQDAQMRHCGLHPSQRSFGHLQELTGLSLERLKAASNQDHKKVSSKLAGHALPYQSVIRLQSRICPACLHERPYHRQIWNLVAADCCPIHRIMLISRCHECEDRKLGWARRSLSQCLVGHDLSQPAGNFERLGDERIFLSKLLHEKAGIGGDWEPILPRLPKELQTLTMRELIDLLYYLLGVFNDKSGDHIQLKDTRRLPKDDDLWQVAPLLVDWPGRFHGQLRKMIDRNVAAGRGAMSNKHLSRIKGMFPYRPGIAKEMVLAELSRATTFSGKTLHAAPSLLNDGTEMIGIASAAAKLNISHTKFPRMVELAGYVIYDGAYAGRRFIKKSDFEALARQAARRRVPEDHIRKALGINSMLVRDLVRGGAFGADAAIREGAGLNEHTYVYLPELKQFTRRIDRLVKPRSCAEEAITFGGFKAGHVTGAMTIVDVILALLNKEIRAVSGTSAHLGKIQYLRSDLERLLERKEGAVVRRSRAVSQGAKRGKLRKQRT